MNLREIAKRARVSTSTASRAINRIPTVAPHLAKRVWKAADDLGYYPNTQARALVSGKSKIFGLIVSDITNPFFPEIIQEFGDIAVRHQYEILLSSTLHESRRMKDSMRRMLERRVDGVAVMTFGMEELLLEGVKLSCVPLVFVDVCRPRPGVSNIRIDYLHGIRQAVQHLAALRHKRIAFIAGPLERRSAIARRDAFMHSMAEIGIAPDPGLIVEGNHTIEGGMEATSALLKTFAKPTAILCSNDMTAIGVMRKCYEDGILIPRDLSLVGFDDVRFSQFTTPPLTTVQMSQIELAKLAFSALLAGLSRETPSPTGYEYLLRTHLVLRKSTAMAPLLSRPLGKSATDPENSAIL